MWMVVLVDGRYFTIEASCLKAVSIELHDRDLIDSDYEILSLTQLEV